MGAGVTEATITCPECGHLSAETMPGGTHKVFHQCQQCGVTSQPLEGDCCVFCSYSDQMCPPKQAEQFPIGFLFLG